jgi:hypothetical protein
MDLSHLFTKILSTNQQTSEISSTGAMSRPYGYITSDVDQRRCLCSFSTVDIYTFGYSNQPTRINVNTFSIPET